MATSVKCGELRMSKQMKERNYGIENFPNSPHPKKFWQQYGHIIHFRFVDPFAGDG